jgi:GWxTD domain-containing protein
MFNETTKPGWKTDRGEIFIFLGAPNILESDTHPDVPFPPARISTISPKGIRYSDSIQSDETITESSGKRDLTMDTGFRGIERWIYFQSKNLKIPPHMIIAFYKNKAGEYVLSDNPQHYTNPFPGLEARTDLQSRFAFQRSSFALNNPMTELMTLNLSDALPPFSFENSIAFKLDLAEILEAPTVDALIDETVTTLEFFNKLNAQFHSYFFLGSDDNTRVILQGILPKKEIVIEEETDPILVSLFGKLEAAEEEGTYTFANDSTIPGNVIQDGENLILLSSVILPPGIYKARIGILNLPLGTAGNFEMPLTVPDLSSPKPSLSSIVLTSSMEYTEQSPSEFFGGISIRPKASSEFHQKEHFGIYYQVYHLDRNKKTDLPDYHVTYKFYKKREGTFHLLLPPTVKEHLHYEIQGWTFPLEKWPDGEFLLEISVKDNISRKSTSSTVGFKVREETVRGKEN